MKVYMVNLSTGFTMNSVKIIFSTFMLDFHTFLTCGICTLELHTELYIILSEQVNILTI